MVEAENGNAPAGQGIGRLLEEAREGRGLTLQEVERETRIRSRYLRALEREEFDVLPAVYVLGSLKTYADFLGLDGAALSRGLKADLVEPEESGAADGPAGDEEYAAAPVLAVGFDQLFVGAGVILIAILAIMTLVAAVAQHDDAPVSQLNYPSTPESPSEMVLAGNTENNAPPEPRRPAETPPAGDGKAPEASKEDKDRKDGDEKEGGDDPQASSPFDGVEFVPMSPASDPRSSASASATAVPAASSPPSPEPSSAATATAGPGASSASPAPASPATQRPNGSPDASPAPSPRPAVAPAEPGGAQRPQPGAERGPIAAEVDGMVNGILEQSGID